MILLMSLLFIRYFSVNIPKYFENCSWVRLRFSKKKKKESFNAFYDEYENVDKFFVFAISFEKLKRVLF